MSIQILFQENLSSIENILLRPNIIAAKFEPLTPLMYASKVYLMGISLIYRRKRRKSHMIIESAKYPNKDYIFVYAHRKNNS